MGWEKGKGEQEGGLTPLVSRNLVLLLPWPSLTSSVFTLAVWTLWLAILVPGYSLTLSSLTSPWMLLLT